MSPDGTCVIGSTEECLVNESTFGKRGNVESVTIDEQIYRIRYSGPDNALERFTITSVDPIVGNWSVYKESTGMIPEAYAEEDSLKIKYRAQKAPVDTGVSEETIPDQIIEFGGIIPEAPSISIHDVKVAISDEGIDELLNIMVRLDKSTIVSGAETYNKTLSGQPLSVSALVDKPIEFTRAELRIVSSNEPIDNYHAIKMDIEDLEGNPAFAVLVGDVAWELISHADEIIYWIQITGETSEESTKFTINVIPDSEQETIEFGGIIDDTISKLPLRIELVESMTLAVGHKDSLQEIYQTIAVPQTIENHQNTIWILMIIFLTALVFGLRKFKGPEPIVIRRQENVLLIQRTVQGMKQFVTIRNYSSTTFRNCLVLCNNIACDWYDSGSSYPRSIEPGEAVSVEIKDTQENDILTVKSDNDVKTIIPLNSMFGVSGFKFN